MREGEGGERGMEYEVVVEEEEEGVGKADSPENAPN